MTEPPQYCPSLMDLSVAITPLVRIEEVRLANTTVRSELTNASGPFTASFSFDATTSIDHDHRKLIVRASLLVSGKSASSPDAVGGDRLHIETEYVLVYAIESLEGIAGENAEAFGRLNGIHNVWPYWREYIQSTTARLGLPPLTMPPITGGSLLEYYTRKQTAEHEGVSEVGSSSVSFR